MIGAELMNAATKHADFAVILKGHFLPLRRPSLRSWHRIRWKIVATDAKTKPNLGT